MIEIGRFGDFNDSRKRESVAFPSANGMNADTDKLYEKTFSSTYPQIYKLLTETTAFYEQHFGEMIAKVAREKRRMEFETPNRVRLTYEYELENTEALKNGEYYLFNTRDRLSWLTIFTDDKQVAVVSRKRVMELLRNCLKTELGRLASQIKKSQEELVKSYYVSISKGIVLLNVCNDLSTLDDCFNRVESIKENIFNIHLRTIKIDSIMYRSVYNCVKTGLYFPNSNETEIKAKIKELNKDKNAERKNTTSEKDYFAYMQVITKQTNLKDTLGQLNSRGYKYEYFEELTNLISAKWHSYKRGDLNFRLTSKQKEIVRSDKSRLRIKGVAGCGKTQVVANRAVEQHLKTGDRVLIITFNISLIQYIRMRISQVPADFAPNMFEITNYHQFFKSKANQYVSKKLDLQDFDDANFFDSYRDKIKKYKTIIIDEIQDFKESWIQSICNNFLEDGGSLSVFGDGEQNIYDREMEAESKMPSLKGCGFPGGQWGRMSERLSMRILNPQIATLSTEFARQFVSPETEGIATQQEMNFGNDYHIKYWNVKKETTATILASNIRWIIETFKIAPEDMAVLGQSINLLRDIEDAYSKAVSIRPMINFETKTQYEEVIRNSSPTYIRKDLEEIRRAAKTHFTTACPQLKLSTIHSFKGWESNSIVLILQPEMSNDESFEGYKIQERENTPALIYTALTRAKCNLFIINLGNPTYNQFFTNNIQ